MEAIEEPPLQNAITEATKANITTCEESSELQVPVQTDVCHKPNGVAELHSEPALSFDTAEIPQEEPPVDTTVAVENNENVVTENEGVTNEVIIPETAPEEITKEEPTADNHLCEVLKAENNEHEHQTVLEEVEVDGIVDAMPENVRFETEILIETNVDDQASKYKIIYEDDPEQTENTNIILNEIGENIELSEVLRSSDVTDNAENNNCDVAQEVFNKEELLDILEGNDMEESQNVVTDSFASNCKQLETQLALQQLTRLKQSRKYRNSPKKTSKKSDSPKEDITPRKRNSRQKEENQQTNSSTVIETKAESVKKKGSKQKDENVQSNKQKDDNVQSNKQKDDNVQSNNQKDDNVQGKIESPKEQSIVNALVQDWEDDEPTEGQPTKKLIEEGNQLLGESEELVKSQEATVDDNKSNNVPTEDGQTQNLNKSDSETQPHRRLSRVIKKKIIFDPDNPDTYITKTKTTIKKEITVEKDQKDQSAPKKMKTELTPRAKSKSPVQSKLQWKKPQPKNIKSNKRLTEIDRLLMDEGAVNMICQLTPEAPQGNKNMKSKAEFIKKIQRSTPEGKEMKFRERKKECKLEEGDAKRVGSSKERLSLNSSVKSPTVSEDFEAHSADDSIIYRRHSSSSYSSPCMSPRRMSDVDSLNQNSAVPIQQAVDVKQIRVDDSASASIASDAFMANSPQAVTATVINKSNLLSIKEKLNSKLSMALNKRKRENTKAEKPSKIKKVSKSIEKSPVIRDFKYVKLTTDQRLAEICILHIGAIFNTEVINELKTALDTVESKNDVSVTLLSAESGILCSGLELNAILDQETGANHALELAESVRSLLSTLESHSKLVCAAVGDKCHGLALSLVALSDVTVASENASFQLAASKGALLHPGAAVLTASGLPQSLLNELLVFERPISAAEAVQGGLVSRTVWPDRVQDQARAIARDIATQPHENIMLKKQLLRIKRGMSEAFLTGLQTERDLFVNYWTSAEGRELVRASVEVAKE